jgi:hypothetical protein
MLSATSEIIQKNAKEDRFQGHDYYNIDELLSEEHLIAVMRLETG